MRRSSSNRIWKSGWGPRSRWSLVGSFSHNAGEFFFRSPIDPTDLSKDWGRSDDDQRHRLVVSGSASLPFQIQLSGSVQAYSSLPFNITSGLTTLHGTTARPIVDGLFIDRNGGIADDFFSLSTRLSRWFHLSGRLEAEAVAEAFNLTNRRNDLTRNTNFGSGAYPSSPLLTFGEITAVGDPRSLQFALRLRF